MKRGEIWVVDLGAPKANKPGKQRPAIIVQSDMVTQADHSTITVCLITSESKPTFQMRLPLAAGTAGLDRDSNIMIDQIRTLDRIRFKRQLGTLDPVLMQRTDHLLRQFLDLH